MALVSIEDWRKCYSIKLPFYDCPDYYISYEFLSLKTKSLTGLEITNLPKNDSVC